MNRKTYGLVALIASIAGFFIPVGSIVGLIFAILGKKLPDDGDKTTTNFLTAGLIISIVSLVLSITCWACYICGIIATAGLSY
ncbi:MAG: LPXTG cell wall anchor domain-containing protein [Ruminococcus sp.]|jgi:uncharacterized Tic20 family protein|nr:LPXTG cell wall anchor domain-containing protein [Ruminococcus sp.]